MALGGVVAEVVELGDGVLSRFDASLPGTASWIWHCGYVFHVAYPPPTKSNFPKKGEEKSSDMMVRGEEWGGGVADL